MKLNLTFVTPVTFKLLWLLCFAGALDDFDKPPPVPSAGAGAGADAAASGTTTEASGGDPTQVSFTAN